MKARLKSEVIAKIRHPKRRSMWPKINELYGITSTSNRTYDILKANEWNGKLTTEGVLQYLEGALGMNRSDLLETIGE